MTKWITKRSTRKCLFWPINTERIKINSAKYTGGQKKRYSRILSCITCGSQTRAAQAYHDQNFKPRLGVILICRFCLPGKLANIYVYIFYCCHYFSLLSNSVNFARQFSWYQVQGKRWRGLSATSMACMVLYIEPQLQKTCLRVTK